ncbi:SIR2 family protein [Methyloceanibacter sp. wino2]|uniref:SIR2 family NAD-dependent protein deacylase n=1 Tax=Methyloceanibacter sp. wino2 TaxID=2170729 RepID=UPI000D3E92C4|nr:SIR2 family protein [Methyloceanibacter sp. wino2]
MQIESLPDYPALRQVQDALWKTGEVHGAAVMVGAGFSRFADRAAATTPLPPLWQDFRDEMLSSLYPEGGGPSDPLELAEEYRAALGEQALENLLRGRIRDEEWTPGPLHQQLLRLPWADVLTTNWDTLLERAKELDPDYDYSVVRVAADIARARSPRIVKLHGSLPSHGPFIFSEEDFRTYPQRFAPFVNLAQEVLLENELCLLGFSGDDPNFLKWAGWVRDQLGKSARPIRLIGVLNLSPSRRRLLEGRNITPVDLAPLVSDIPREDRHRRATEVFLESLWQARPRTASDWTVLSEQDYSAKELPDADARLTRLVEVWAKDRQNHPGWLITPLFVRERTRHRSFDGLGLISANLQKASAPIRASILYEAVWRWKALFWQIPPFIEEAIESLVTNEDDRTLPLERRVALRAAITRLARLKCDWPAFDRRIASLEALPSADAEPDAVYQRCLRARDQLDYSYVLAHSDKITGSDPVWLLRRASLLAEILDAQEAARAIQEAYEELRRRRAQDRRGLWLLSREAWATWLMQSARYELDETRRRQELPDWPSVYKDADADPWDELQRLDGNLSKAETNKRKAARDREPMFDAGTYRIKLNLFEMQGPTTESPYIDLLFLSETVGIPPRLGSFSLLEERLARAIDIEHDESIAGAWAALRSITSYDRGLINDRFSRIAVARLPLDAVQDLISALRQSVEFGRTRLTQIGQDGKPRPHSDWVSRLRTHIELLSRLSLSCQGDEAIALFRLGASLLHDPATAHWWLFEAIGNLMRRSLQALEPDRRREVALEVLSLPLACEKDILGNERDFPEISDLLGRSDWSHREGCYAWSSRIAFLINVAAENKHEQSREQAVFRLFKLFEAGALLDNEASAFGEAIWRHTSQEGLPANTNLLPHIFIELPHPSIVNPRTAFDAAVVRKLAEGSLTPDLLRSLEGASYKLNGDYVPYRLYPDDARSIIDNALEWNASGKSPARLDHEDERTAEAIAGALASTVIPTLSEGEIDAERCCAILAHIADRSLPSLLRVLPALVRANKSIADEAHESIRNGLSSLDSHVVVSALSAIYWLARFARNGGEPIPYILAAEVVSLCVMRREQGLTSALSVARDLVAANAIDDQGMRRLIEAIELVRTETSYETWSDEERRSDVGLIREAALRLAAALKNAGSSTPSIDKWMEEAATDPLPEVRYAIELVDAEA